MSNPAADYRHVLRHALATLPPDSHDAVRADITRFLERAPSAGADFECGADFPAYRARQELLRLKDLLLEMGPQPVPPQVCYAVPFAVDLSRPNQTIDIYGFDLDQVPLEMVLVSRDGFKDVTFALTRKTHYHLTFNLGDQGVRVAPSDQILGLAWGHLIYYAIPLIQTATRLCESRIETIPAGKTIAYAPPRIGGDSLVTSSGPRVWADLMLDYESNKVDATFCVAATQQHGRSTFSGCGSEYVYTTEPERVIEQVFGQLQSDIVFEHGNRATVVKDDGVQGDPVGQWTFVGFGGRIPAGTDTRVTFRLNEIRVVSTETGGCVSAIAYLEAKRMNGLSPRTMQVVDPQLGTIDPEILTLRPRFAPPAP